MKIKKIILIILLIGFIFALSPLAFIPAVINFKNQLTDEIPSDTDFIIVLGSLSNNDEPSVHMTDRLEHLIKLLKKGDYSDIPVILSGGDVGKNNTMTESELMEKYLREKGIKNVLLLESNSRSTRENLKNTKDILHGNVLLISSDYHCYRINFLMKDLGVDYKISPAKTDKNKAISYIREVYALYAEVVLNFIY